MTYGKNQLALLKFLEKYPNRWHRIKRNKAIYAARRLENRCKAETKRTTILGWFYVKLDMPQMLIKQN